METTTCPVCDQQISVSVMFMWPDGEVRMLQNHGTATSVRCAGSLRPAPVTG